MNNKQDTGQLDASCRVAFAALIHDLGKFAERAALQVDNSRRNAHITNYCKWHEQGEYHSHTHAAYTAIFLDVIEESAPDFIAGETAPFVSRTISHTISQTTQSDITDSLINAAAMHHRPETLLQWIIATADRIASGFERETFDQYNEAQEEANTAKKTGRTTGRNHYQARLLPLFEQVRLEREHADACAFAWCYPLRPLSPKDIFPVKREGYEPAENMAAQAEYRQLWEQFLTALQQIPTSHRKVWPLWLDHFDTLWQQYTHAIPSATAFGVRPEVSLYDHSKATAAFAVALWRWHEAQEGLMEHDTIQAHARRSDWNEEKLLLVQGDFFGIQDFIFAEGAETNTKAAKLLRGRSFMVSLFTELAALKVLEILELPSTSQIINAAGKFQIVAPNTPNVREKLRAVRREINAWFLKHTLGLAGLGLVWRSACCNDFLAGRYPTLMEALFADLEQEKFRRFDLTGGEAPTVFDVSYNLGVCQYNNHLPADRQEAEGENSAQLSRDQIKIGAALAKADRLLVVREDAEIRHAGASVVSMLETSIFGYRIGFTQGEESAERFDALAKSGGIVRFWDFSLPDKLTDTLWHGYARRSINAYVPRFDAFDQRDKYCGIEDDDDLSQGNLKTFSHLACEDRSDKEEQGKWIGQIALTTLKGDVDNLGKIFLHGLKNNTFAKTAALSRQMNDFFAVWLPALCREKYPNCYTVFAGGDDFFLIGPWRSTQDLVATLAEDFKIYVAENPEIHFSAGMVTTKPKQPVYTLAESAEEALNRAKDYSSGQKKNAVCLYGEVVAWKDWQQLAALETEVRRCAKKYALSTGYIYGLLHLIDLAAASHTLESVLWHSRFVYRTRRYVVDKLDNLSAEERKEAQQELTALFGKSIGELKGRFRIPLFNYFYSKRQGGVK